MVAFPSVFAKHQCSKVNVDWPDSVLIMGYGSFLYSSDHVWLLQILSLINYVFTDPTMKYNKPDKHKS